jgi:hypothetical protein
LAPPASPALIASDAAKLLSSAYVRGGGVAVQVGRQSR